MMIILRGEGMRHVWETGVLHTGLLCGDLKEGDHLQHIGVDWRILLKWTFKKWDGSIDSIDLAWDNDR
jgi:hypothetical protein